ncbi:MAG: hypothetical protein HYS80_00155 [Candidatus Aenigmarchaeota archaeon]|nr:hypothetical protein [Candidatus Aenigmarchaeota archaeon]
MSKAVATQAVFLVGVIAILFFFITAIFFGWIKGTKIVTTQATCVVKQRSYCSEWSVAGKEPDWWGEREPKNCESADFQITKPSCNDCKKIYSAMRC